MIGGIKSFPVIKKHPKSSYFFFKRLDILSTSIMRAVLVLFLSKSKLEFMQKMMVLSEVNYSFLNLLTTYFGKKEYRDGTVIICLVRVTSFIEWDTMGNFKLI